MDSDCQTIINAINISMDANSSQNCRLEAYNFLEKIKTETNLMIKYGRYLCNPTYSASVRHFALQLLEDAIKFHWNTLCTEDKTFIKDFAMELLENGTLPILEENMHIKDQVSRLIVEMMKREWPLNWQNLLGDLHVLAAKGITQAELVLFIFLRISEDVAILRNFKNSRRQDMYRTLNHLMGDIFNFFFSLLEDHYIKYKQNPPDSISHREHCRLTQVIFATLTSYVEWVSLNHIFSQDKFFSAICTLIVDSNLSMQVTECLLQIVLRRERVQNKLPAQLLFDKCILEPILTAANLFSTKPVLEHNYRIVKGLAQVISNLGMQLASIWGKEDDTCEPPYFQLYLNALIAFTVHPSLLIYSYTKDAWRVLFRNEVASKSQTLLSAIPQWMPAMFTKILKSGYPSQTKDEASLYSIFDFDSDSEYQGFFKSVKGNSIECLRDAILLRPDVYFELVERVIEEIVIKATPTELSMSKEELEFGTTLANEWIVIASVTESSMQNIFLVESYNVPIEKGVKLLEVVCKYSSRDPVILLAVLETMYGLCCFLPEAPQLVQAVVTKLLEAIIFNVEYENKSCPFHRLLKNLHRESCTLLMKLFKKFPKLFILYFPFIDSSISQIGSREPHCIGNLEWTMLSQARATLSKQLQDLVAFDAIIEKTLTPFKQRWINLKSKLNTPELLLAHIGVTNNDPALFDTFESNRRFISLCLSITLAVIKSVDPRDKTSNYSSDFVDGVRKIVLKHIFPMLLTAYSYCRSYHGIWCDGTQKALSPLNKEALELSSKEIDSLLGMTSGIKSKCKQVSTNLEKIRTFIFASHDTLCVVIGSAGIYCAKDFYQMPNITDYSIFAPLYNLKCLPDSRLRHILRSFIKEFCSSCPPEQQESVVLPLLNHLCPIMLDILTARWQLIAGMASRPEVEEADRKEMVQDMLIRCTARDYIELLRMLLISSPHEQDEVDCKETDVDMGDGTQSEINFTPAKLSRIGRLMLSVDSLCHSVVSTLLLSLSCTDSVCMRKAIIPLLACIAAMVEDYQQYLSDDAVSQFLMAVLKGIHIHGKHDSDKISLLDIGNKLYILLRPKFEIVRKVLEGIGKMEDIDKLDKLVFEPVKTSYTKQSKIRRDCFHAVIKDVVGQNIGERFKKDVDIKDIPPVFFKRPRQAPARLDEETSDLSLCALFECGET